MCTINVSVGTFEPGTLVVWANRDEHLDRDWAGPTIQGQMLAPTDLVAGGTWLAVGAQGLFAGLTNRFSGPPDADRDSRGALIAAALAGRDLHDAVRLAQEIDPTAYNPFHLVLADTHGAVVVWSDGGALSTHLPGPLFAISERSFGAAPSQRETWLSQQLPLLDDPSDEDLLRFLGHHHDPTLDGVCVHWEDHNYGTRSSTVLRLGRTQRYLWTAGPPCVTPRVDDTALLRTLLEEPCG